MFEWIHQALNAVLFGPDSDLAWAGVRAITGICALIAGHAAYRMRFHWLIVGAFGLGLMLALKVSDDLLYRNPASHLTPYFLLSNTLWCVVLIAVAKRANTAYHEQRRASGHFGGSV